MSFISRLVAVLTFAWTAWGAAAVTPLYVGTGTGAGGIYNVNLNPPPTATEIVPMSQVNTGTGIAIDPVGRNLYWIADTQFGNFGRIRRSKLDGSNIVDFVISPTAQPAGVEIDPFARRLYYSERFSNAIKVVSLDGGTPTTLMTVGEPRGLELDLVNKHIYWAEFNTNRIRRTNLDGGGPVDIRSTGVTRPFDVTVDPIHGRLYWVELGPSGVGNTQGNVWMCNLDGSNPYLIAANQLGPTDLVIDHANGLIYWGQDQLGLTRANLDGTGVELLANAPAIGYRNLAFDQMPIIPEPATLSALGLSVMWILRRVR